MVREVRPIRRALSLSNLTTAVTRKGQIRKEITEATVQTDAVIVRLGLLAVRSVLPGCSITIPVQERVEFLYKRELMPRSITEK